MSAARDPVEAARRGMLLALHAAVRPDRPAVISDHGGRTFQTLNARANQLVCALRARGLKAGDGVSLICSNRPEFAEAWFAAQRSGLRITPVNWHLGPEEIRYIVEDSEARAVIADVRFAESVESLGSNPAVRARLAVGGALPGFELYEQALHGHPEADIEDPELGGPMLYTSGTTGHPKGVYRARPARAQSGLSAIFGYRAGEDAHLCTGPLYHAAPLAFSLVGPLSVGVPVVLMDAWDSTTALALIDQHRVTHTHMVPTMFHRLLALPEETRRRHDLSSLRMIVHGAAPCPVPLKQALMEWLGPIVYEYYAATEGFGTFVTPETWLERPGTVGKPAPDHVRILDDEGMSLDPGRVGRIFIRATAEARFEYFKDPAKTRQTYEGDGHYFTLGDVGYLDEDGYLFLSDRSADVIISGGVNVYPAEIDAALLTHPAIEDCATVGVPSADWGEEVRAVVTLRPGNSPSDALEQDLIAHCRARLAGFKCPRQVDFVDDLPRHDTGKIFRRQVRDRYWQGQRSKI